MGIYSPWSDRNQMMANKLNFGVMGDYPLIVSCKVPRKPTHQDKNIAGTGYNLKGSGNAIVVPNGFGHAGIEQLKGARPYQRWEAPPQGMLLSHAGRWYRFRCLSAEKPEPGSRCRQHSSRSKCARRPAPNANMEFRYRPQDLRQP
jgi:hypothetical protein